LFVRSFVRSLARRQVFRVLLLLRIKC